MENTLSLFDKIYETANTNMKNADAEFSFGKETFHAFVGKNPQIVQYGEFTELSDEDMFCLLYLRCLNRLPDPMSVNTLKRYQKLCDGKRDILLTCLLRFMKKSNEFRSLNKEIVIGQEFNVKFLRAFRAYGVIAIKIYAFDFVMRCYGLIHRTMIEPVWKRLPLTLKNRIRKLLHREVREC